MKYHNTRSREQKDDNDHRHKQKAAGAAVSLPEKPTHMLNHRDTKRIKGYCIHDNYSSTLNKTKRREDWNSPEKEQEGKGDRRQKQEPPELLGVRRRAGTGIGVLLVARERK